MKRISKLDPQSNAISISRSRRRLLQLDAQTLLGQASRRAYERNSNRTRTDREYLRVQPSESSGRARLIYGPVNGVVNNKPERQASDSSPDSLASKDRARKSPTEKPRFTPLAAIGLVITKLEREKPHDDSNFNADEPLRFFITWDDLRTGSRRRTPVGIEKTKATPKTRSQTSKPQPKTK